MSTAPAQVSNGASQRAWRLIAIVFLSNTCIMVLELAIGRIVAPYVGTSLYPWTLVISVVLAGISVGNYVGGRLADRWASPRLLGSVFALSGLTSLGILAMNALESFTSMEGITRETLPTIVLLAAFAVVLCFAPCVLLGTISPIVAKLAVKDLNRAGRIVGQIYAAGAVGSIAGTFAAGFVLISWLGAHVVVWSVGTLFLLLSLPLLLHNRRLWMILPITVIAGASWLAFGRGWLDGPCTRESNYFCIIVRDDEINGRPVRMLILDRLIHSYSSLDDPTALVYGYERSYAEATAYQARKHTQPLRALFVGGGGYTFPRYMEAVYPDSRLDVVEIDPSVTEIAHDMLGLRRDTRIATHNEDARTFLRREPTNTYDLVFGDAFNDYSVPYHLTTLEFNDRVRAWLSPDGLYVVNIIDGPWGRFLRAYIHTLRQTFPHVYPAFSIHSWRQSTRSTIIILASDTPLDMDALEQSAPQLAGQILSPEETDALLAEDRTVLLTDRYTPVDQLLFPVFLDQLK
jgi:spermidine synthase